MQYTLIQIEANPSNCFDNMSVRELYKFETAYYARIQREYDRVRREREEEQQRKQRFEENERKYFMQVLGLWHRIKDLWQYPEIDQLISIHGRSIGNTIHDLPTIWTGYESVASLKERERKRGDRYKPCLEHFYPRQWAGEYIINQVHAEKGITMRALLQILTVFRLVHKVTSEENRNLMKYQNPAIFVTPVISYDNAGIELVQVKRTDTSFVWV